MNPFFLYGLGIFFLAMGAVLFALTFRKVKPLPVNPNKSQLRDRAVLAAEAKKMKLAAAVTAAFGALLILMTFF